MFHSAYLIFTWYITALIHVSVFHQLLKHDLVKAQAFGAGV